MFAYGVNKLKALAVSGFVNGYPAVALFGNADELSPFLRVLYIERIGGTLHKRAVILQGGGPVPVSRVGGGEHLIYLHRSGICVVNIQSAVQFNKRRLAYAPVAV